MANPHDMVQRNRRLTESLASAQRGKEAAEYALEQANTDLDLSREQHAFDVERLQQERDRLAARLDAAEELMREARATLQALADQQAMRDDFWQHCRNKLTEFLSSSPSTSAVAEEAK